MKKKKRINRLLKFLLIATGVASVVTQIVVIREMIVVFYGNEYVACLILFCWLVFSGIGTLPARFVRPTLFRLGSLSLFFAALSPLTLAAARGLRDVFFLPGASFGFYPIIGYICLTTMPYAVLVGFLLLYTFNCAQSENAGLSGASVYLFDNMGDIAGGILFSFLLVFLSEPFSALLFANGLLVFAGTRLLVKSLRHRFPAWAACASVTALLLSCVFAGKSLLPEKAGRIVRNIDSKYGRITVTELSGQYNLFVDGIPAGASNDPILAEKSVHFALSQLSHPDRILLISAVPGMIRELEKYNPRRIDYVELDPAVSDAAMDYGILKKTGTLHVIHEDARAFLFRNTTRYDAIINSLPEPDTFQLNRFYTDTFFSQVRKSLAPDGVYAFSVSGFENYMTRAQKKKLSILYATVSREFSHVLMLPGDRIFFLCANRPLATDICALLSAKKIDAPYIKGCFYGDVTPGRMNLLKKAINPDAPINTDFFPKIVPVVFSQWFLKFSTSPGLLFAGLVLFMAAYLFWARRFEIVLFSSGWALMGAEIIIIFAFQVFFGYLYYRIGMIITVFLLGLLPGALIGRKKFGRKWLVITEISIMAGFLIIYATFFFAKARIPEYIFYAIGLLISTSCGIQFAVVLNLEKDVNKALVHAFSADFLGAANGAIITSVVFIPILGIGGSLGALLALKGFSFASICLGGD